MRLFDVKSVKYNNNKLSVVPYYEFDCKSKRLKLAQKVNYGVKKFLIL